MKKNEIVMNEDYRMKVVNFLKIYGYYEGVLVKNGTDKKYVSGELGILDIIRDKGEFKKLKMSVDKVLEYCYMNSLRAIEEVMKNFYLVECLEVRKRYGGFFDRF